MKKILTLALGSSLILSACAVPFLQPTLAPAPTVDLAGTAGVFVQASLQAQPSPTLVPSNTPVVTTPTVTEISPTPTETQNSVLLTLTATLGTGTVPAEAGTPAAATLPGSTSTNTPFIGGTATQTLHPRFFGTLPPYLPFGKAKLINKAKAEAYISLQCTTAEGFVTVIEYPVVGTKEVKIPLGRYVYVAWIGGRKIVGSFSFGDSDITIRLYRDKVVISN